MLDTHTHTLFSFDGHVPLSALIQAAIERGVTHLAITDHCDYDVPHYPNLAQFPPLRVDAYYHSLCKAKEEFAGKIELSAGIELSYDVSSIAENIEVANKYKWDYILNSVHILDGEDPYVRSFYDGKEKEKVYTRYLRLLIESVHAQYPYDTISHPAYLARTAPYDDKVIRYSDYSKLYDELLSAIIERDKCLEVNSHTKYLDWHTVNDIEVYRTYYRLGGRKLTYGSDAHVVERLLDRYQLISSLMKDIGFEYWTYYRNGKEEQIPID